MKRLIYAEDAIDALCDNCDDVKAVCAHYPCKQCIAIEQLPSVQPETCAYWDRESNLCALHRPSVQPEIIHCGDCKYKDDGIDEDGIPFLKCLNGRSYGGTRINDYCSWAERRQDDT